MLLESSFGLAQELAELKEKIELLSIGPCCLSGSGSAIFCIIESGDEEIAGQYKHKLEEKLDCKSIIVTNNRW